jgi:hypothetical protein
MNEADFAFRIRQALNEGADSVSYKATLRLARARQLAVARARGVAALAPPATVRLPALQLASAGGSPVDAPGGGLSSWLRGAGFAAPMLALAIGFVGIYHWHSQQFISEMADVDFAVLLDETPIAAYADKSFGALLSRPELVVPLSEQISLDGGGAIATDMADETPEEPSEAATSASPGEPK